MSNKFKIGDLVMRLNSSCGDVVQGALYTIIGFNSFGALQLRGVDGAYAADCFELVEPASNEPDGLDDGKKYVKTIYGLCGTPVEVDVYRVLDAYPTDDAALDHAIKKALNAGNRGHKDKITDYKNIEESARKARILLEQKMVHEEQK
jgi:hypothetical protein